MYAIVDFTSLQNAKSHLPGGKWSLMKSVLIDSVRFVVHPLNDPLICEAEILVILQGYDQMLMHLNADHLGGLNDAPGQIQIFSAGFKVVAGVIVTKDHGGGIGKDCRFVDLPWYH